MTDRRQLQQIIGLLEYLAINHPIDAKAEEYRRELNEYREHLRQVSQTPENQRH
jgi:hypothetical protein